MGYATLPHSISWSHCELIERNEKEENFNIDSESVMTLLNPSNWCDLCCGPAVRDFTCLLHWCLAKRFFFLLLFPFCSWDETFWLKIKTAYGMKGVIWITLLDHNLSLREQQEFQGGTWLAGLLCVLLTGLCLARFFYMS